jgi:hypothetical protein
LVAYPTSSKPAKSFRSKTWKVRPSAFCPMRIVILYRVHFGGNLAESAGPAGGWAVPLRRRSFRFAVVGRLGNPVGRARATPTARSRPAGLGAVTVRITAAGGARYRQQLGAGCGARWRAGGGQLGGTMFDLSRPAVRHAARASHWLRPLPSGSSAEPENRGAVMAALASRLLSECAPRNDVIRSQAQELAPAHGRRAICSGGLNSSALNTRRASRSS